MLKTVLSEEVPSVSQLTRRIRGHLENSFFDVWVKGEISNFKTPGSGHAYFCLKDEAAQLKAVMFRPSLSKVKFQIKDGMEILLHGRITVYEARGEYQMVADTVEPVGTGALQLAFEQLKQKLFKEGLFDLAHKKPLPRLPKRIGIVTSETGAAVKDILNVLGRRFPNLHVVIFPTSVQGEKAASEIGAALAMAERWNAERPQESLEVLIVGRGGGSLEDLWPFNEESVARAIFQCSIPIISAVGHEIDFTISDFVADLRAPTPSAAAELVIPRKEDLAATVLQFHSRVAILMQRRTEQVRLHLGHLTERLVNPRERVRLIKKTFEMYFEKLRLAMEMRIRFARQKLEAKVRMLDSLSPLQVIGRGYSLVKDESGSLIQSVKRVKIGQRLTTRVTDGVIESEVLSLIEQSL